MNYKNISKNEAQLLNKIEKNKLTTFGTKELKTITGWEKTKINNLIHTLTKKNIITKIKRNHLTLTKNLPHKSHEIATEIIKPSYVSLWTALSYYGFTEQQTKTIQLISTKQKKDIKKEAINIEVTTLKPDRFYGYRKNNFPIAEKEKALIDSLFKPDKVGGLQEYTKCLTNAWSQIEEKRFIEYLIKFNNKSMTSRAGYLIEETGLETKNINTLQKNKSQTHVKLNPNKPKKKKYNNRWNININEDIKK